jgi:acyl-coenzyme A thioesterase PaaI-like protein
MLDVETIFSKAKESKFYLWLMNQGLDRMIPFNLPHGFRVVEIGENHIRTKMPYKKRNLNHLKGLHACALATLTEITAGSLLISRLSPKRYRIILKKLEVEYQYQGKTDAFAEYHIDEAWLQKNVIGALENDDAVLVPCEVKIFDKNGNQLTTGTTWWQIKDWQKVKTKVS